MATSLEQQNTAQQVANEVNASANIASGVVKKQVEESTAAVAAATKKGESDRMAMVTEDITALPPDDIDVKVDPKSLKYQKALAEKYASDYDEMMANQGLLPAK